MADDSVLKVVELFVDNINEANKNVTRDLDRIDGSLDDLNKYVSTPPRHRELEKDHTNLDEKLDLITIALVDMKSSVRLMINTVRVSIAILALAFLITGGIVHLSNKSIVEQLRDMQKIELKASQGAYNEKLKEGNG